MLKHEDCPGLAKLSAIRAASARGEVARVSILTGNGGGLFLPEELRRGADGAMTGFAYPEMMVGVCRAHAAGDVERAHDLFDAYLPLARYEQQPGIGLAVRKHIMAERGVIAAPRFASPAPSCRRPTWPTLRGSRSARPAGWRSWADATIVLSGSTMNNTIEMSLDPHVVQTLSQVTTATLTTILLKKGLRNVWLRGTRPSAAASRAWWAAPSPCASCRRARTWPRRNPGRRPSPRAPPSKPCPQAASPWPTRWASPMPASLATSCAPAWPSAASRRWSPTAWCATWPACWAPACRCGATALPRRLRWPA